MGSLATRLIFGAVVLGALLGAGYYFMEVAPSVPACSEPITYRIGPLDPRFGVSDAEFRAVLREAASVWNEGAGKTLIIFAEDGEMPVSLVYDERQEAAQLGTSINADQRAYDTQRALVDSLVRGHESRVSSHEAQLASFERAKAAYDKDVAYWNSQGGAPPGEYEKLERTRRSLEQKQRDINASAEKLNEMIVEINAEVQELNTLALKVNKKVNVYNESAGEEFDQGQYVQDKDGTRITIYEFRSREQLVRAVAHEFGHALGISHTEDPQSLMYPYNSGRDIRLHAEDQAALDTLCATK